MGVELWFGKTEKVLEMDGGGDYTTMCMYLMQTNYTLKNG